MELIHFVLKMFIFWKHHVHMFLHIVIQQVDDIIMILKQKIVFDMWHWKLWFDSFPKHLGPPDTCENKWEKSCEKNLLRIKINNI